VLSLLQYLIPPWFRLQSQPSQGQDIATGAQPLKNPAAKGGVGLTLLLLRTKRSDTVHKTLFGILVHCT